MSSAPTAEFGQLLRNSRRQHGLSQIELGGDRYSGSYISLLESGRREPTSEVVDFLSRRLGVSPLEWGVRPRRDVDENGQVALAAAKPETVENLMVAERAWYDRDWLAAETHASLAARSAAAAGEVDRYWEARYVVAQAKFNSGDFAGAAEVAELLAEHDTARRISVARAQALSLASIAHRANDRLGWAVAFGARAVEAAESCPPTILTEALMSLVSALAEAATPEQVRPYLVRLDDIAKKLVSDHAKGMVNWTLGTAAYAAGDPEEGAARYRLAATQLQPQRDLRLWLRFHRSDATCRLRAGITEGVADLLRISATGLEVIGNDFDVVELRQAHARLALLNGDPQTAIALIEGILQHPVLGAPVMQLGRSQLILAEALSLVGRQAEALNAYRAASTELEREGRLQLALSAVREVVEEGSKDSLTSGLTTQSSP